MARQNSIWLINKITSGDIKYENIFAAQNALAAVVGRREFAAAGFVLLDRLRLLAHGFP
jgi:hypothetical protein